jgi:hypothetical protein
MWFFVAAEIRILLTMELITVLRNRNQKEPQRVDGAGSVPEPQLNAAPVPILLFHMQKTFKMSFKFFLFKFSTVFTL